MKRSFRIAMRLFKKNTIVNKRANIQSKIISRNNFTYENIFCEIEKHIKKNSVVLDAGCGEGNISLFIATLGNSVLGVDKSKKAIIIARKKTKLLGLNKKALFYVAEILDILTLTPHMLLIFLKGWGSPLHGMRILTLRSGKNLFLLSPLVWLPPIPARPWERLWQTMI